MNNIRCKDRWFKVIYPKLLKKFSPRLEKDLLSIKFPEDLPETITSCYIHGNTGVGKTILAAQLLLQDNLNKYLKGSVDGGHIGMVSVPDLFYELRKGFSDNINSDDWIEKCKQADVLLLDEISVRKPSEWALEVLYIVINHRYEYHKTTIITSNFDLDELAELFGDDRITSRIERFCKIITKTAWKK